MIETYIDGILREFRDDTVRGGVQWAAVDQHSSANDQWGLFTIAYASRPDIAVPFNGFAVVRP